MRSVFFGTPAIAVPSLEALAETSDLTGVVCQPDRPQGRGLKLQPPEVKQAALRLGVPVFQPLKVRDGELLAWLRERNADIALVLAYGRILPPDVLAAPKFGCLNLHASLLPRYRGAAPINWVLINGESETGMSLMQMDAGLDTGPVYAMRRLPIASDCNAQQLSDLMAQLGAQMVREDLPRALSGELPAIAQDTALATHAPALGPADFAIDFGSSARQIVNRVRGLSPRPGARALIEGRLLRILAAEVVEETSRAGSGSVLCADKGGIVVQAQPGSFRILEAQIEGKKALPARDLVNGRVLSAGQRLHAWLPPTTAQ